MPENAPANLLEVEDLRTHFFTDDGIVRSVDGVDLSVPHGRTVCIVGESGSGKTITARSIMQLIARPGRIVSGSIRFAPKDGPAVDIAALAASSRRMRAIRGREIAMIFQEPMTAFSPVHTVGEQIAESLRLHFGRSRRQARADTVEWLARVGIPRPEERYDAYAFQLSGGMRQRAMIAMALVCSPRLLIADEPTTALDVTMQANVLDLVRRLQAETRMSILFVTHDLGVVAEIADEVVVMYLGRVVEQGSVFQIFDRPRHPYTRALLRSVPKAHRGGRRLAQIDGAVPHPLQRPGGCPFHPRCRERLGPRCAAEEPEATAMDDGGRVRCFLAEAEAARVPAQ
jgi:oligopeptide/dipeptide ABC transporter ATP-binding protein